MKKPKTYNLDREIYEAISKLAKASRRSDSDWLNIHLGNSLPTKEVSKPKTAVVKSKEKDRYITHPAYPLNLNLEAWSKWLSFRKLAKFKSYKSSAPEKELANMGTPDEQMLIVQQSIDNEYQGLFPIKQGSSTQGRTSGNLSACEEFINGSI